jgi:O-antigen/teichoic acid export membrane protein
MSPRPSLVRGSVLSLGDSAISLASALIVSVLLARTLGPERFGLYALVTAIVSFSYIFAQLGIPSTVRRYVAELDGRRELDTAGVVAARGLRAGLLTALVAALAVAAAATPVASFFHHPELRDYLLIGAGLIVPMLGVGVLRGALEGLQQYRYLLRVNLVTSPLWLAMCILALWTGAGIAGILFASLATEVLIALALGWRVQHEVGIHCWSKLPEQLARRLIRYNWTLAIVVLLNVIVWQRSELFFLGRFWGPAQVSYYAVPFALTGRIASLAPGAILAVLLPGLTYAHGAADHARFGVVFSDALRYLAIVTLPICLFGIPLAPVIIQVLYGPGFSAATVVLQILLVAVIFGVLGQASQSALLGAESQGWLLKTGLAAAVLSIGLDLALIPRWGAMGAALANTAVQAAWALTSFAPLWHRLLASHRAAIVKAAGLAATLAVLLSVLVAAGTPLVATTSGLAILVVYGFGLQRLHLFRPSLGGSPVGN